MARLVTQQLLASVFCDETALRSMQFGAIWALHLLLLYVTIQGGGD
jgi:hypothetical protein